MSTVAKGKKRLSIMSKILIGFVLGIIAGLAFGEKITFIKPVGDLFIRLLRMLVVPLIFSSLVVGVASMEDMTKMGRVGIKTIICYLTTTLFAIVIGLGAAFLIKPGIGVHLNLPDVNVSNITNPSLVNTILEIVPKNPMGALASGKVLQIICFAIFIGIAIVLVGKRAKPVLDFCDGLAEIMYKLTNIVIGFAPYGVFALIAYVVGAQGAEVLIPLLKVIITVYLGCAIHIFFVQGVIIVGVLGKCNPWKFFKHFSEAMLFSFVTASSSATLPVSMRCCQKNMGVSKSVSSFVQPLGATINMDGTSMYQGICVVFLAQLFGLDLNMSQILTVLLTALLASIGTAGVPGAGLIMLTMVVTAIGLPPEGIAIVAGVDRILDAARCVPNVTGDAAVTLVNAVWEDELDRDIFEGKKQYVEDSETITA